MLGDLAIGLQNFESDGDCRNSRRGLSHNQKLVLRHDCLVNYCAYLAVSGLRVRVVVDEELGIVFPFNQNIGHTKLAFILLL